MFVLGVLLISVLLARRVKGAILIGIAVCTVHSFIIEAIAHLGAASDKNPEGWQHHFRGRVGVLSGSISPSSR